MSTLLLQKRTRQKLPANDKRLRQRRRRMGRLHTLATTLTSFTPLMCSPQRWQQQHFGTSTHAVYKSKRVSNPENTSRDATLLLQRKKNATNYQEKIQVKCVTQRKHATAARVFIAVDCVKIASSHFETLILMPLPADVGCVPCCHCAASQQQLARPLAVRAPASLALTSL